MSSQISSSAVAAREGAREQDTGRFGEQAHGRADDVTLDWDDPTEPAPEAGEVEPDGLDDEDAGMFGRVVTIATDQAEQAEHLIEKANRRLERAGVEERFTFEREDTVETRKATQKDVDDGFADHIGDDLEVASTTLTLNRPRIGKDGWHFDAALDRVPGTDDVMIRSAGTDHGGWAPEDPGRCDHCGKKRARNVTYLVTNDETGEQMQLGSSCVSPFLGMRPEGLWALQFDLEGGGTRAPRPERTWDNRRLIAQALAATDGGQEYVSKNRALDWNTPSTSDTVGWIEDGDPFESQADREQRERLKAQADQFEADGTVDKVLAAAYDVDPDSDYGHNLQVILDRGYSNKKMRSTAISAVAAYGRQQRTEAREKAKKEAAEARAKAEKDRIENAVPGFLGQEKERVRDVPVTITDVATSEGQYGITTRVNMLDEHGREVVWWASGRQDVTVGEKLSMTATVKKQGRFRDVDQTTVTRAKLTGADGEDSSTRGRPHAPKQKRPEPFATPGTPLERQKLWIQSAEQEKTDRGYRVTGRDAEGRDVVWYEPNQVKYLHKGQPVTVSGSVQDYQEDTEVTEIDAGAGLWLVNEDA